MFASGSRIVVKRFQGGGNSLSNRKQICGENIIFKVYKDLLHM